MVQVLCRIFFLIAVPNNGFLGKSTISKILKERGFGVRWSTPPHDLLHLRAEFDSDPVLKTAFYALGNYIAAMQVSGVLRRHNVIMDRSILISFNKSIYSVITL